jgi:hypothetical protein
VSERTLVFQPKFGYFADRVPERMGDASVATLEFRIGKTSVVVRRALSNMQLREVKIANRRVDLTEKALLEKLASLCNLPSAYDYYMVVRYLQFFTEERLPILWSSSTQFEIFKMLFLENADADRLSSLFARIQHIDSDIRNRRYQLTQRQNARKLIAESVPASTTTVTADMVADQRAILDAAREALQVQRTLVDKTSAKLDQLRNEQARLEYDADEQQKELAQTDAAYINQALPLIDAKLKFLMQGLGSRFGCFVCGTVGRKQSAQISKKLRAGHCFVCNATLPKHVQKVVPLTAARVRKLERTLEATEAAQVRIHEQIVALELERNTQLAELQRRSTAITAAVERQAELEAQLPQGSGQSPMLEEIRREEEELAKLAVDRKALAEDYREAVGNAQRTMDTLKEALSQRIAAYATRYLHEDVSVRFERNSPFRVATGVSAVNIPTFRVAMTSSTSRIQQLRQTQSSVSESQKEFLDLAFRLAVLDLVSQDGAMSLVVETPEASLDAWFMLRAADMMRDFAAKGAQGERRVVATSNLNGTKMIESLLGGPKKARNRTGQLINLVALSAMPAVLEDVEARAVFDEELKRYG